jgi:hypothetical protein
MNLGKYLFGIREEYFHKISSEERKKQFFAFNLLAMMFFVLVSLSFIAGICYGLVVFQVWSLAIITGVFLGGISFVLLLLVLFLNMTTNYQKLYSTMTDMSEVFKTYQNQDLSGMSDEKALQIVQTHKMELREKNLFPDHRPFYVSGIIVSLIKVVLIIVLSCIAANGLEMLIFKDMLNESMDVIKNSPELNAENTNGTWAREMLEEKEKKPFLLINCQSIIMIHEILSLGLGKWKVTLDLLFFLLYLIPFILVKKSSRYASGLFLKEVALSDISISLMAFLLTQRKCQQIKKTISDEYDYDQLLNNKST